MDYLHISKAQSIGNSEAPSLIIIIDAEAPSFEFLGDQDMHFALEARVLESCLYRSLPGGLYDRLLAAMLTHKASHFRVSHAD